MDLDAVCKGELCERAFELIAIGAPSIIALFLIIYAHRILSARLKEASEGGQADDALVYRTQLNRVWGVALVLLLVHSGIFVWTQFRPKEMQKGYVQGSFREFEQDRDIDLESRPTRLYMQAAARGDDRHWVITGSPRMVRETFMITSEGTKLICPVDFSQLAEPPTGEVELRLAADTSDAAAPVYRLDLLPSHHGVSWDCNILLDDIPPAQPDHGGPLDVFDATDTEGAEGDGQHGWFAPLFGVAHAASERSSVERTISALESDDYRVRRQARDTIARDFEPYREWAEYVASQEMAYQSGQGKYGRPSYRHRLGLVYALSRRHAIPRRGLMQPPDLSDSVLTFALEQGLIDDKHLRASASRFAISYPGPDVEARLEQLWGAALTAAAADGASEADLQRALYARELMVHFRYNRGILIILARRDDLPDMPPAEEAFAELARAEKLAQELPEEMRYAALAKILYGIGWVHVVGFHEEMGQAFNEDDARSAFNASLAQLSGREKGYPYAWQIDLMQSYLANPDYGLFNK